MNRLKAKIIIVIFSSALLYLTGCASVKPYQQIYLNDEDMQLTDVQLKLFETNFQTYREAASGANGGKVGGGCGCN